MSVLPQVRRLLPQPLVACATSSVALFALVASWSAFVGFGSRVSGIDTALGACAVAGVVATYRFPLHLGRYRKVYVSSVAYYLLSVLVPPALAGTAAGLGALVAELSVQNQRGTLGSDIATQVGRRVLVVLLAGLVAHASAGAVTHTLALVGAGAVLFAGDVITYPLLLTPMSGEPPLQIMAAAVRDSYVIEGVQYLIGLLGALVVAQQFWAVALLALPTALAYRAFQASERAQEARRMAEEAHARTEADRAQIERLAAERAAILAQIGEGIIIADPTGRITFANDAAQRILGAVQLDLPMDAPDQPFRLLTVDGQPYPTEQVPLVRALRDGGAATTARWRIRRADGLEVVVQGGAVPVHGEDGTELGAVLTVHDVTDEYDLERQKDDFLSAISHDLGTPLTTIKGRIQLLQWRINEMGILEPELLREELRHVDASTKRAIGLVSELLDMATMRLGRPVKLDLEPVDLVALVRRAIDEQNQAGNQRISLTCSVPHLVGLWDAQRLERVLSNLIANAIKYSPEGGSIAVAVKQEDACAVVSVADQGIGVPARDLPSIFEPFHRARNTVGKIPGTGIGLAAVRSIIAEHRGIVTVTSQEGTGSTFTVRLPLSEEGQEGRDRDGTESS